MKTVIIWGVSIFLLSCDSAEQASPMDRVDMLGGEKGGSEQNGGTHSEQAGEMNAGHVDAGMMTEGGSTQDGSTDLERRRILEECVTVLEVSHGSLCAIQPSTLDPETLDAATDLPDQRGSGFGYHVIALPHLVNSSPKLWIHFGGTYGRPFDRATNQIAASAWLDELMDQGYTVVQPAYDNKTSISFDCGEEPGKSRDNCAGEAREEVLTGQDLSPYRDTNRANSVDYRLERLLSFFQTKSPSWLPTSLDPTALNWPEIYVSGHSQGGNLSYYLARRRGVRFACMLAAPFDSGDDVNPGRLPIADWFTEGESQTPKEQLAQLIATEDPFAQAFLGAGRLIGLREGEQSFSVTLAPYYNQEGEEVDGHSAPLADPNLASYRAQACLR